MKKLLAALLIVMVSVTGCSDNSTKETTESNTTESNTTETKKVSREQEIRDSTTMLDKKLADPNSNYSPDSLK